MNKTAIWACLPLVGAAALAQTSQPLQFPKIDRRPPAADLTQFRGKLEKLPAFNPDSNDPFQMDLRSFDIAALDLRDSAKDLLLASFDTRTRWPAAAQMPADFDSARILEIGKNPGLGVRALHARGVTGRGVSIAIIDQPLIIDHAELGDRIRLYEEINVPSGLGSEMHGPAVSSIAAGKTVGVAPEAEIYYIATYAVDTAAAQRSNKRDFRWYAQAIRRVLEVNEQLPRDKRICAISLSAGWTRMEAGFAEMQRAVKAAKDAGVFVTSSNFAETYGRQIHGLGRGPLADPDRFDSYTPGMFWAKSAVSAGLAADTLLIPMDCRTTAAPNGVNDYAFYRQGGWSWITPYLAGMYALAAQVKPDITPAEFIAAAAKTGHKLEWTANERHATLGVILDPAALIDELRPNSAQQP